MTLIRTHCPAQWREARCDLNAKQRCSSNDQKSFSVLSSIFCKFCNFASFEQIVLWF